MSGEGGREGLGGAGARRSATALRREHGKSQCACDITSAEPIEATRGCDGSAST
jgi:hypothetical protein